MAGWDYLSLIWDTGKAYAAHHAGTGSSPCRTRTSPCRTRTAPSAEPAPRPLPNPHLALPNPHRALPEQTLGMSRWTLPEPCRVASPSEGQAIGHRLRPSRPHHVSAANPGTLACSVGTGGRARQSAWPHRPRIHGEKPGNQDAGPPSSVTTATPPTAVPHTATPPTAVPHPAHRHPAHRHPAHSRSAYPARSPSLTASQSRSSRSRSVPGIARPR